MIRILKASAGSGKTYALAKNYLSLLTQRYAYRHILAVTFTNKATAEMKNRILKFLYESDLQLHRQTLADILHDYSAFAVSTIDRFFQQALKAFAREIGQVADYQIEIDREVLVTEAMDRILDSLTADQTDILGWLKASVSDSLDHGQKPNIEASLYDMGKLLMKEERRKLDKAFSKERLAAIRESCRKIIEEFTEDVNTAAGEVTVSEKSEKYLADYKKGHKIWERIKHPNATLSKEAAGTRLMDLFDSERFRWYNTALMLRDQAFSLGLAGEFFKSFDALLKEKNVLSLDESNVILKDIIAGSDAPFVYEKLGVRYENFLLDEFQDTSGIQWENFRPLLHESDASGHEDLIVGDVKQSIYRFRDSDWTLLAKKVKEAFPQALEEPMEDNWRSLRTIVGFNNEFFRMAAETTNLQELYADVAQNVRSDDPQEGYVRISYCDSDEEPDIVLESIAQARKAGAIFGDIAILVRNRDEGTLLAGELIRNGIPVISDDSLTLKSSLTVRKLVGLLANHENPDDRINAYLAESENVVFPEGYHSLVDLCEDLLRQLQLSSPDVFAGEALYIQAFMDDLREWVDTNGNELRYYLQHWNDSNKTIGSPSGSDAVRIITVHKAKGLQFPYLIFPYAEKVNTYRHGIRWCHLNVEGTPFAPEAEGLYPVDLTNGAEETLFADAFLAERQMQLVDNINIFYVAMTRAEKCLHVIAANPPKALATAISKGKAYDYKAFSEILFRFCNGSHEYTRGSMYDFTKMKRPAESNDIPIQFSYSSIPLADRLKVSSDASDFFGDDGSVGPSASARRRGIVLHDILSQVQKPSDLQDAVQAAVLDGKLSDEEGKDALGLLSERIASHSDWFTGEGLNETTVFDTYGNERRPDRVIISGERTLIIDYKFGERTEESDRRYSRQVETYCKVFRSLGMKNVEGLVWYVVPDSYLQVNTSFTGTSQG